MNIEDLLKNKNHQINEFINNFISKSPQNSIFVDDGVIAFGNQNDYAENFGLQWNEFQLTQFDSYSGLPLTEQRLKECSEWNLDDMKGKIILEIGGGAGRFTEIFLKYGATVVSLDLSSAVYANKNNNDCPNVIFLRGSFDILEKLENIFDYVFCYGVAQHTPEPKSVYKFALQIAKKNAAISIDHYIKIYYPSPFYNPKYIWRPITKRMSPNKLLKAIRFYIPKYIKFDTLIIKFFGRRLGGVIRGCIPIPCWNYYGIENIDQSPANLIDWAIMDTFDALGAKYDYPVRPKTISKWAEDLNYKNFSVKKGGNGVVLNAYK